MENNSVPIKKRCCHCRQIKPLTAFHKHKNLPTGHKRNCKDCIVAYRLANLEHVRAIQKRYYQRNREWILQEKKDNHAVVQKKQTEYLRNKRRAIKEALRIEFGGKCAIPNCPNTKLCHLQFHHIDRKTKKFKVLTNEYYTLEERREEAKKCVLLCSCHHTELHEGLLQLPAEGK
jgi:hypothetical protein